MSFINLAVVSGYVSIGIVTAVATSSISGFMRKMKDRMFDWPHLRIDLFDIAIGILAGAIWPVSIIVIAVMSAVALFSER